MAANIEAARLRRSIAELSAALELDLRPGSKTAMSTAEKRAMKAELQNCMQMLDEISARLSG